VLKIPRDIAAFPWIAQILVHQGIQMIDASVHDTVGCLPESHAEVVLIVEQE